MKKQQKVMYNGIEIFVPVKYDNPRYKITTNIDKKLYEELKNYSKETSIPISKLLDKAIKMFLESTK